MTTAIIVIQKNSNRLLIASSWSIFVLLLSFSISGTNDYRSRPQQFLHIFTTIVWFNSSVVLNPWFIFETFANIPLNNIWVRVASYLLEHLRIPRFFRHFLDYDALLFNSLLLLHFFLSLDRLRFTKPHNY